MKAAEAHESEVGERIVRTIAGRDCVAIEVRYHTTCYQKYTAKQLSNVEQEK